MKPVEFAVTILVMSILLTITGVAFKNFEKKNSSRLAIVNTVMISKEFGGETIVTRYSVKKVVSYSDDLIKIETTDGVFIMGQNYIVEGDIVYITQGTEGR